MKNVVVTGTSSGIGLATTLRLARAGHRVFAGMRNVAKADALRQAVAGEELQVEVIAMDVTDGASVAAAMSRVREHGPVDALINNAGIGGASPLELVPEDEHRAFFETNYFGALRCIQAVVPEMRERRRGCIVNVTSIAGLVAMPDQIPYSASKWALECLGEGLAHELRRFGVRVVNVEPGVIMTNIVENAAAATRYDKHSPYQPLMRRNGKLFKAGFERATPPERVADVILEAMTTKYYRLRWQVGSDAEGMAAGRRRISDEQWVDMGDDLSDEDYNGRMKSYFDLDI